MIDSDSFRTQEPAYEFMQQKLGESGIAMLDAQLQLWHELNERPLHSPLREALSQGGTDLPAGTLVHSVSMHKHLDEDDLKSVAEKGIISGELVGVYEDAETHGCADFFKVPKDMSIADYMAWSKETISKGRVRMGRGERLIGRGISFIVDPQAEGMDRLMEHDGYTDPNMQDFVRPPSGRDSKETAAILGGVPRGAIAGVIVSPLVQNETNGVQLLQDLFPGLPVFDHSGQKLETTSRG